jgi:hypothetical protein
MSIGRTFEEAIQKAVRMVNTNLDGFGPPATYEADWAALVQSRLKAATAAAAAATTAATPRRCVVDNDSIRSACHFYASVPALSRGHTCPCSIAAQSPLPVPLGEVQQPVVLSSEGATGPRVGGGMRRYKDDPALIAEIDRCGRAGTCSGVPSSASSSSSHAHPPAAACCRKLKQPSDNRLWDIAIAFDIGYSVDRVHELSRIDRWFLSKLRRITDMVGA